MISQIGEPGAHYGNGHRFHPEIFDWFKIVERTVRHMMCSKIPKYIARRREYRTHSAIGVSHIYADKTACRTKSRAYEMCSVQAGLLNFSKVLRQNCDNNLKGIVWWLPLDNEENGGGLRAIKELGPSEMGDIDYRLFQLLAVEDSIAATSSKSEEMMKLGRISM